MVLSSVPGPYSKCSIGASTCEHFHYIHQNISIQFLPLIAAGMFLFEIIKSSDVYIVLQNEKERKLGIHFNKLCFPRASKII